MKESGPTFRGVYSLREASQLTGVALRTATRWFEGGKGVLRPEFAKVDRRMAVSFLDLVDLLVVGQFRNQHFSMQTVRKVHDRLAQRLNGDHPFSRKQLLTDGHRVFIDSLHDSGDRELEEVLSGQRAMPEILLPYLRQLEYSPAGLAQRWHIARNVVVDPQFSFGKPIIAGRGVSTRVLAESFRANAGDKELVADLFNVVEDEVMAAVDFEAGLQRRAA